MNNDEIMTELLKTAWDHDILVQIDNTLSPYTPSVSNSVTRRIMINSNWHIHRQLAYHLAHELHHVFNHDSNILYFTPTKHGIEGQANYAAIERLVPLYFRDMEPEKVSSERFMHDLAISSNMRDAVENEIRYYYRQEWV